MTCSTSLFSYLPSEASFASYTGAKSGLKLKLENSLLHKLSASPNSQLFASMMDLAQFTLKSRFLACCRPWNCESENFEGCDLIWGMKNWRKGQAVRQRVMEEDEQTFI